MVKVLRALILPFLILFVVTAVFAAQHAELHAILLGASWQLYMAGLAFTIALSGLGWTECGNDYSRYLPRESAKLAIVGWVFLGTAMPEILIMILGAAVATFLGNVGVNASGIKNPFAPLTRPILHPGLVRGGLPALRHPPALRDQQPRPVLLGGDPPGGRQSG